MSAVDTATTTAELTAREADLLSRVPSGLFIGGAWEAGTREQIQVQDPATGRVIKRIANATPEDGIRALDAAVAAQEAWAATPPRTRAEILRRAFDLLQERRDDFALLMTFSEEAVRIAGRYGTNPEGTGTMVVSQRPVGPCFFITPWNFPLAMATRKIAPALAAGCTVVVKPAELTPLTTLFFAQLLADAGVPAGVVNVVQTNTSGAVSAPIIADPRLRKLSFTGSTPVGRALLAQAAQNVLRTSMELGGNAPFIVFEDADLDKAVEGAMLAKYRNIGQACTAANRFIVHESVADEFSQRVAAKVAALRVGPGSEDGVTIGPLIDDRAVATMQALVGDAVERGARVLTGGKAPERDGFFYEPTVIVDVQPGSEILREEIFGPVLAITTFATEDEAVARANETEYGLVGYVFTQDLARGQRMIDRVDTGMMGLNTGLVSNAAAPFGGVKQSGLGREGGLEGIHEYLSTKYTLIPA